MVAKIADFGLQQDKGFGKRATHPYYIFLAVPPGEREGSLRSLGYLQNRSEIGF